MGTASGQKVRRGFKEIFPQVHDQQLRTQWLLGIPRGTLGLATAAFGAGHEIEVVLPRELGNMSLAEGSIVWGIFKVQWLAVVVDRKKWAESVGAA